MPDSEFMERYIDSKSKEIMGKSVNRRNRKRQNRSLSAMREKQSLELENRYLNVMADSNLVEYLKQKEETLSKMIRMDEESMGQKSNHTRKPIIKDK